MASKNGVLVCLGVPLVLCLGLTACGGNSSGSAAGDGTPIAIATNAHAEGAWHSEQANGDVLDLLLLENGSLYALSSSTKTGALVLAFNQGGYTIVGAKLAATLVYYNDLGTTLTGGVSATVAAGTAIAGSATTDGSSTINTFAVKPMSAIDSSYNYNHAASLASVSGAWPSGYLLKGSTAVAFSIDAATGLMAGTSLGCSFTGSFQPRASGINVFDVSMTLGQAPCAWPGTSYTGIAISYIASNGKRQLTAALQDSTKASGTMLYAQR